MQLMPACKRHVQRTTESQRLPASAVDKVVAENRLGLLDLSIHWDEHLEQIEKAIGRAI